MAPFAPAIVDDDVFGHLSWDLGENLSVGEDFFLVDVAGEGVIGTPAGDGAAALGFGWPGDFPGSLAVGGVKMGGEAVEKCGVAGSPRLPAQKINRFLRHVRGIICPCN